MATTSLWKVGGNINNAITYVENKEKTEIPLDNLNNTLSYAENEDKTEKQYYISGINCNVSNAYEEMKQVKKAFQKESGIVAFHGYQSFKEGEVTPDIAHKIGVELATEMWGDKYQVIVTTHLNTKHIHNHFVVNSVSFIDGKKFNSCRRTTALFRDINDRLCEEHGLSIVDEKVYKVNFKKYLGYDNYSKKTQKDVDYTIKQARDYYEFISLLNQQGYEVNNRYGKLSLRGENYKRNIRIERQFGDEYSIERIKQRIQEEYPDPIQIDENEFINYKNYQKKNKTHGLVGLYRYYCYRLKIYRKNIKNYYIPISMRQDVEKLEEYSKEIIFLSNNKIDSHEELEIIRNELVNNRNTYKNQRIELYNQKTRTNNPQELERINFKIKELNNNIKELSDKLKTCENIQNNSQDMNKKIEELEKESEKNERIK